MKKQIFLFSIALLPMAALSSEPSAFGSSDFSSGTTSTSYINTVSVSDRKPQDSQKTASINETVVNNKAALSNVSEEYEGMRSVMESYATKIAKQDEKMRQLEEENKKLREYVEESRKIQTENQDKIKVVVGELGSLIDSINKNYVPKEKFDQLANELRGTKGSAASKTTTTPEPAKKDTPAVTPAKTISAKELSTKDSATLIKEADDHFDKKSYTEAEALYSELLNRNYKPAKVNFTLGEIAYTQKSYTKAIEYYKSSISLFDKAAYTPTLLYHTGTSFEKLGKTKDAQGFYKALKENYPDSPEAKKIK
ncbi:tetratricopeptide repeat protein [Sulfurospirillum halorespirans]|uniref:TPR repeat containing periplasmic protein n=1 Tax=Sulfurospirillum halorespirans DSM 13726 TaxID=1193502 RepID=A0A1D7THF9_9BACT|nr:tetratricopeptide repeat protein [Sulfurospirillum halorespirans]AOO64472.1 TPR repeat containing periplasmic protein [Sulfurospirillum halorespirans DSM 13726]